MVLKIRILYHRIYKEYRVPGPNASEEQAYYTDDYEDAIDTACAMYETARNLLDITVKRVNEWPKGYGA